METIGERVRRLRQAKGLTSTALARPRFSTSYISQIERGHRKPSGDTAEYLARRLGVSVNYLVTGVPDDLPHQLRYEIEQARQEVGEDQPAGAAERVRAALAAIERYEIVDLRGKALVVLGEALLRLDQHREAIETFERAQVQGLVDVDQIVAMAGLARGHRKIGNLTYAARMIEEFLAAERPRPLLPGATTELCTVLVSLYFELGDTVRAERAAERALGAIDDQTPTRAQANAWWDAARLLVERRAWNDAFEYLGRAHGLMATLNDRRQIGRIHISYAYLCLESDPARFEAARAHLEKAEAALLEADAPVDLAYVYTERSRLALLEGGFEDALSHATEALDAAALIEPLEQARALFLQGRAYASLGQNAPARQSLEEAVAIFAKVGARQHEALGWNELAELSAVEGNGKRAMKEFRAGFAALDPTRSRS